MPEKSTAYRNPTVEEDDDDDDLDDLDDVLASFKSPAKPSKPATGLPQQLPQTSTSKGKSTAPIESADDDGDDDDFEASLAAEMESLLKQLSMNNPPGPMGDLPDPSDANTTQNKVNKGKSPANEGGEAGKQLSPEEEEEAWQKAVEMMLSGEGLSALGLDPELSQPPQPPLDPERPNQRNTRSGPGGGGDGKANFDETIKRTMESLKSAGTGGGKGGIGVGAGGLGGGDGSGEGLAELLRKLQSDPSALDGLGDLGDDDDDQLGGLLDGMMSQLMTKEILEEPMSELASKYPGYLANPPSEVSATDLEKYKSQEKLVNQIISIFRKPGYTDEKDGKEIGKLVGEMQDLGGPPKEIMGDLPEGFDLGALDGEGCTIM